MKVKVLFNILLLLAMSRYSCLALISVGTVTPQRALEWGMKVRSKPSGPDHVWVELEFKPEGRLERFQYVSLEILDGEGLLMGWTPLKDQRTSRGSILVRLMVRNAFLEKITLRIVHGDLGENGEDVRLRDFIPQKRTGIP